MDPHRRYDREMDHLEQAYENGELTGTEINQAIKDLDREMREFAEDEARQRYDDIMGNW